MCLPHSICLLLLGIASLSFSSAQQNPIDSLEHLLTTVQEEDRRLELLIEVSRKLEVQDPAQGLVYGNEAYEIASRKKDTIALIDILNGRAICNLHMGYLEQAETEWRKSFSFALIKKQKKRAGIQLVNLGNLHDSRGNLDSATYYNEKALEFYYGVGDALDSAIVYNNLGIVLERLGNYSKAIEYYIHAKKAFDKAAREDYMSAMLVNIGNIYMLQNEPEEALTHYRQSLSLKKKVHDRYGEGIVYNSLGTFYAKKKNQDSSIYYFKQSLNIKEEMQDTLGLIEAFIGLGNNYGQHGEPELALQYHERAYALAKRKEIKIALASAAGELGKSHILLGNDKLAETYLLEALFLAENGGEPETQLNVYKALSGLLKKKKDPRAFEIYEKYIVLDDSLRNDKQTREITRLGMQYEFDKEKELLALEQQKKELALNAELERQVFQRNIGLGAIGSGLIILALLWRGYRVKQRNNHLLEVQKNNLVIALEERENLLKEIHHRVKNNLQVVSSLLSIQSRSVNDPAALDALEEGRNRVKAMGLIHQNLYQEDNLVGVNLSQYLEKLTDSLLASYKVDTEKIHIARNIDAVSLDVDILIPLGLILNELISNSLKYAFPDREEGNIALSIAPQEKGLLVEVQDDGVGMPSTFQLETASSMGYKLIKAFVRKMKADLRIHSERGTRVQIRLPDNSWIAAKSKVSQPI